MFLLRSLPGVLLVSIAGVHGLKACAPTHSVAQIQGAGGVSPMADAQVTTSGIVTGRKSNGFFIQMPAPGDGDPDTSDGIFVYTSKAPAHSVVIGAEVCVSGVVREYVPSSDPSSAPQTEIDSPQVTIISSGNALPPPVLLTVSEGDFSKYEGMRVAVDSFTVVAPTQGTIDETTATATSDGIFYGVVTGVARPFQGPGIAWSDPQVLSVNSLGQSGGRALDVTTGQVLSGVVGPLELNGGVFTIDPDPDSPPVVSGDPMTFVAVPEPDPAVLTIASFNMERFYDTVKDPSLEDVALTPSAFANRLNKASLTIRNVLHYPDILGVEEMGKLTTLQTLAAQIDEDALAAGDPVPSYAAYLVEGNDISGINVGFLVKTTKIAVVDVTQYGKDTRFTEPSGSSALLNDRPPLVLRAMISSGSGELPLTVIVNHLRSLDDINDPTEGPTVRAKRQAQAQYLANLIQSFQANDPAVNLLSIGDYNAYQFSDGYVDVMGIIEGGPNPPLVDLNGKLPPSGQYSYSYNGVAEEMDHILANPNMAALASGCAIARNDADFPEIYRNDPTRPERVSDHDIPVAYFTLPSQ